MRKDNVEEKTPKSESIEVIVIVPNLNLRVGPGRDYEAVGFANEGRTTLAEIYIAEDGREWGRLEDNSGWIDLEYTRKA